MQADIIIKVQNLIETLNSNQQIIARNLLMDSNFIINEMTINGSKDIYIKDITENNLYHFETYVKSKCNC